MYALLVLDDEDAVDGALERSGEHGLVQIAALSLRQARSLSSRV
jgi:hypothetical protein